MSSNSENKLHRIEDLKTKLFNKSYRTKTEQSNSFTPLKRKDVMDSWKEKKDVGPDFEEKFFMKTSMFKKFFMFSLVFFILALAYASYVFFYKGNNVSNNNIDISVLSNAFTAGGEEYPLQVGIVNRNSSPLELADLVIEYPKSSSDDLPQDNERFRESLGTIPAGGVRNENIKIVLFGEQGSIRQIKISLEYRVEGSNAIFVKDKLFGVSITSTPIDLSINAPAEISPNQDINLDVKATLNAVKPVSKVLLKVDYPIGFQFISAKPMPFADNNIWNLGDLSPGTSRDISILGKMLDVFDGEEKIFHVSSGVQSETDKSLIGVVFNSLGYTVMVKKSSVEARLVVNGVYQREYAVDAKTPIQGQIEWANNLETKINDLKISAKITGNAVDRKTIYAQQGFYDSSQDLIVWDKNSSRELAEVNPGDTGVVSFSVSPLQLFSAANGILSEPSISINISITGRQAQGTNTATELKDSESKIIRIISDVGLATKALYYSGPFANSGPIPPKAEQKTTYTITWSLSNTANSISKARVRSTLPSWVKFSGPIYPLTEDLTYNTSTGEIIWNIGGIPKGTGITESGREVSFQVELLPSSSQVGTTPIIINDATLNGHDNFAGVDIVVNKTSLNTRLVNDPDFLLTESRVVQ